MNVEKTGTALPVNTQTVKSPKSAGGAGFSEVLKSAQPEQTASLDSIFEAASARYGVSVGLLKAVAKAESNFKPDAVSHCGAMGIMQLMPGTAKALGVTDPFDPEQNIMGGAKYLSGLLSQFGGDVQLALAAYNAGPNNVVKYGGIPPFDETQNYVSKVLGYLGSDITAGGAAIADGGGVSSGTALGELIKYSLLTGLFDSGDPNELPGLLGSLGDAGADGKNGLSDSIMSAVYQLQLRMLTGGDDSKTDFFV